MNPSWCLTANRPGPGGPAALRRSADDCDRRRRSATIKASPCKRFSARGGSGCCPREGEHSRAGISPNGAFLELIADITNGIRRQERFAPAGEAAESATGSEHLEAVCRRSSAEPAQYLSMRPRSGLSSVSMRMPFSEHTMASPSASDTVRTEGRIRYFLPSGGYHAPGTATN